jgi:D-alanyl-D-alanine carboxypeptidase
MAFGALFRAAAAGAFLLTAIIAPQAASAGPSILIDAGSGKVLSHEEAFRRWYPASLTKLMTAYVAFRAIEAGELTLQSPVRVTARAAKEPPSKMGYGAGSVMTLDNALKMLMVKSANDIATAVAENVAGSVPDFIARMNAEARRIGMTGSRFANAHGLHDPQQYTTARDIGILAQRIRSEYPQHAGYFSIEAITPGKELVRTYNMLIGRFPGADGMKTGFVCASGFNLVASATREGRTLIAVVLGALSQADRADRAADLLAQGFLQDAAASPALAGLQPYGIGQAEGTDMRPVVCTKQAQADRWDGRDAEGRVVLKSPHIGEMTRDPVTVTVGLGGATGPAGTRIVEYADVPIPTPRPNYTPTSAAAAGSTSTQ